MQFARFVRGRSSAREVADSYTRYYTMRMEVARQQEQGGAPVRHVLSHQAYMFNELAASVYPLLNREDNVPEELSDSVTLLFGKDHLWNWQRVIDVLGILTMALRDNVKPSYISPRQRSLSLIASTSTMRPPMEATTSSILLSLPGTLLRALEALHLIQVSRKPQKRHRTLLKRLKVLSHSPKVKRSVRTPLKGTIKL